MFDVMIIISDKRGGQPAELEQQFVCMRVGGDVTVNQIYYCVQPDCGSCLYFFPDFRQAFDRCPRLKLQVSGHRLKRDVDPATFTQQGIGNLKGPA
jgi:hypothetical protein